MADDAGALLVRTGLITDQALVAARAARSSGGGTLGEHLVLAAAVSDDVLTEFFRSRLLVPKVNPNTLARLAPTVVEAIPEDMAIEFRCVPVALDREGNLTVAMSDPSDRHAVDEIGFFTGKYVVRAVATQMQIAWCLGHYYGHITELGRRLLKPAGQPAAPAPIAAPAPVPVAAPPAAPIAPMPRVRGFTGRVDAARHKVMVPGVTSTHTATPRPSDQLLTPTADDLARIQAAARAASVAAPVPAPVAGAGTPSNGGAPIAPAAGGNSEPYAQVHVSLLDKDELTPPRGVRRNKAGKAVEADPPELAARGGEIEVHERATPSDVGLPAVVIALEEEEPITEPALPVAPARAVSEPEPPSDAITAPALTPVTPPSIAAIGDDGARVELREVDDDDDGDGDGDGDEAAVIHDVLEGESQPILLVQRRPRDTLPEDDTGEVSDVVLLERRKSDPPPLGAAAPAGSIADALGGAVRAASRPRREKRTVVGVGIPAALPRGASLPPPGAAAAAPTAAPIAPLPLSTSDAAAVALRTPADGVPAIIEDHRSDANTRPHWAPVTSADIDEGWGPPGTTIPPPFLGALPGTELAPTWAGGSIPIAAADADEDDSAPLLLAHPIPPPEPPIVPPARSPVATTPASGTATASGPTVAQPPPRRADTDPGEIARELELASTRLVELLRQLDRAGNRDEVVDDLLAYLAESHDRVAFLILKGGSVTPFKQRPPSAQTAPLLSLDRPSTLQDVVGTRLPYRGAVADDATSQFVLAAFGVAPAEALILPVAVRDRVVAVLYGDGRRRHSFDEHFAIAGRAAGLALERILQSRRGSG